MEVRRRERRRGVGSRVCGVGGIIGFKGDKLETGSCLCCLMGVVLRDCLAFFFGVSAIGSFYRNVDNCFITSYNLSNYLCKKAYRRC